MHKTTTFGNLKIGDEFAIVMLYLGKKPKHGVKTSETHATIDGSELRIGRLNEVKTK